MNLIQQPPIRICQDQYQLPVSMPYMLWYHHQQIWFTIGDKTGESKERQKIRQLHGLSLTFSTCSKLVHLTWFLDAYVGLAVTYHTAVSDILSIVLLLSNLQFWKNTGIS
jgi:hypothetical protein